MKSWLLTVIFLLGLCATTVPSPAQAAGNASVAAQAAGAFNDTQTHWAKKEIAELAEANVAAGFTDGSFRPQGQVTREQFLKMLVVLRDYPKASNETTFPDVKATRWSSPYIAAGLANGIILADEYPNGFKPEQAITRYEMAVWIVRALRLPPQKEEKLLPLLKDQAEIRQTRDLIEAALRTGIVKGYPDGKFHGGNESTRAEAAVMLVRALHYSPDSPDSGSVPGTGAPEEPTTPPNPDASAPRKIVEYRPEVKRSASTDYSRLDDGTWIVRDPKLDLKAGDVFVLPPSKEYYGGVAKKVVTVKKANGDLVVATSVPKLREVFAKLDIHTTEAITPKMLAPYDSSVKIETSEVSASRASLKLPCFNISMNNAKYDGLAIDARLNFCNLGVNADIGLDVDVDWFDVDLDFYSQLVLLGDMTTNVAVRADTGKGALTKPQFIPVTAPFYVPVFTGVFVKGQLYLRIDLNFRASLAVEFEDRFHLEEGFNYSLSNGFKPIHKSTNTATLDIDSKFDASLSAGPDFRLTLTLLDIAYAGIDLYPGIRTGFTRNYEQGRCDSLNVDAFLKLDVMAGYDIWVASDEVRLNLIDLKYPLFQQELDCPPPPPPGNLKADLIGVRGSIGKFNETILNRTDVQLNWNAVNGAASYNVMRAEAPNGPYATKRSKVAATAFKDATATIGKTYYYRVTAVNDYGESSPSPVLAVAVTMQPPPAPQNLTAARSGSTVALNWTEIGGFVGYNVKRAEGTGNTYTTIGANVSGASFTDSSASILKRYSYIVTAVDKGGESGPSNVASVDREELTNIAPVNPQIVPNPDVLIVRLPAPGNFAASTEINSGRVTLSWNAVQSAASYNVKRSTAENGVFETIGGQVGGTSFTDTTAAIGTTYYYKVFAVNGKGAEGFASPVRSAAPGYGIR